MPGDDSRQSDDLVEHTALTHRPATSAPQEDIGHFIVQLDAQTPVAWFRLESTPLTIGRDAAREIVLASIDVSRLHARVWLAGPRVMVEDLGSTNGTFVNGRRLTEPARLHDGALIEVGGKHLKYERRSRREIERAEELHRDLEKASRYVLSLLPPPLHDGPIHTEWQFVPSAKLGGDSFGYDWLDTGTFTAFIIDVSGHGIGAAMHSVSVLNILRRRAIPATDFRDPAMVLSSLNTMFQMENHDDMYFTMWYGVVDTRSRTLTYASAGHHPTYLVDAKKTSAVPLKTAGLMIGASPQAKFRSARVTLEPGSALYLFSDGVYEITTPLGQPWRLEDFVPLLLKPAHDGVSEPERLHRAVRRAADNRGLEDDFSVLVVETL
jgi:serine phosphatase RsbU (regulator of sigma subunit)